MFFDLFQTNVAYMSGLTFVEDATIPRSLEDLRNHTCELASLLSYSLDIMSSKT